MIVTNRLVIKPIRASDAAALSEMLQDSIIKKTYMIPDLNSNEAIRLADRFIVLSTDRNHYVRGIYHNDALIGWLNDTEISGNVIELGWVIRSDLHNNGFATESVTAAINELLFCGYTEIVAGAFIKNPASIRVMEKAGMIRMEKTDEIEYRGEIHTCVYFHITKNAN
jgi:RimJ/RimL family protein N-acetyltransferase